VGMQEHPNVTLVKQGFEAFDRRDTDWIMQHFADDIVWHIGGTSKLAGSYKGMQEISEVFARQDKVLGDAQIDLHDVVGNDEHVIAIGSGTARDPDGGTAEWKWANVFQIKDGKIAEVWGLSEDPTAIDRLIDKLV
jgi:ketosteroid isomerase-like protein